MAGNFDIIIIDRKGQDACGAGCGLDWSAPDNIVLAKERVRGRFNREADIAYHDAGSGMPPGLERFKEYVLPVLLINGRLRISGQFDMRMLLEAVDTELEISRVGS